MRERERERLIRVRFMGYGREADDGRREEKRKKRERGREGERGPMINNDVGGGMFKVGHIAESKGDNIYTSNHLFVGSY